MCNEMFSSASVLSRLEETGVVDKATASEIGLVGLPARASDISIDVGMITRSAYTAIFRFTR